MAHTLSQLSVVVGLLAMSSSGIGVCHGQVLPVSSSWTTPKQQLSLGEPVIVTLTVRNDGAEPVSLNLGVGFVEGLKFDITLPTGASMSIPPLTLSGIQPIGRVSIGAGANYMHEFVVDQWYGFDAIGNYEVRMKLRFPLGVGGTSIDYPMTGSVAFAVTPRDEAGLRILCSALARRVQFPTSADDAFDAATALSYVSDPVAVEYLIPSMTSPDRFAQGTVRRALGKFATPQAVEALIPIATSNNVDVLVDKAWAEFALIQIANRTQDPGVRSRIHSALGK